MVSLAIYDTAPLCVVEAGEEQRDDKRVLSMNLQARVKD
jgi:hypothetical protein